MPRQASRRPSSCPHHHHRIRCSPSVRPGRELPDKGLPGRRHGAAGQRAAGLPAAQSRAEDGRNTARTSTPRARYTARSTSCSRLRRLQRPAPRRMPPVPSIRLHASLRLLAMQPGPRRSGSHAAQAGDSGESQATLPHGLGAATNFGKAPGQDGPPGHEAVTIMPPVAGGWTRVADGKAEPASAQPFRWRIRARMRRFF